MFKSNRIANYFSSTQSINLLLSSLLFHFSLFFSLFFVSAFYSLTTNFCISFFSAPLVPSSCIRFGSFVVFPFNAHGFLFYNVYLGFRIIYTTYASSLILCYAINGPNKHLYIHLTDPYSCGRPDMMNTFVVIARVWILSTLTNTRNRRILRWIFIFVSFGLIHGWLIGSEPVSKLYQLDPILLKIFGYVFHICLFFECVQTSGKRPKADSLGSESIWNEDENPFSSFKNRYFLGQICGLWEFAHIMYAVFVFVIPWEIEKQEKCWAFRLIFCNKKISPFLSHFRLKHQ